MNTNQGQSQTNQPTNRLIQSSFQRLNRHMQRRLIAGFFVLAPLLVTFLVLRYAFGYVDGFFRGETGLLSRWIQGTVLDFPGFGIVLAVILLYLLGILVAVKAGRRAVNWQHAVLTHVPVVKNIYGVAKQATDSLTSPFGEYHNRVVLTHWPKDGSPALGIVTGQCHSLSAGGKNLLVVYIPTVPVPATGNLAFMPKDDVIETDFTVEEAMKMIVSGGMVLPDRASRP